MHTELPTGAPLGIGSLADGDDIVLVLEARAERRRIRLLGRVLRGLVLLGLCGACATVVVMPVCTLRFPCLSRQSEAKINLKALYVALEVFRAEHGSYSGDFAAIDFEPRGVKRRYRFAVTDVTPASPGLEPGFIAWAIADERDPELAGDVWRIDSNYVLTNLHNRCKGDPW